MACPDNCRYQDFNTFDPSLNPDGSRTFYGDVTIVGNLTVTETSTFNDVVIDGSLVNNGSVTNNESVTNNGTTTNNGQVINNNSVENNGPVTNNGTTTNNGQVINNQSVTNNGTTTNNGQVINNNSVENNGPVTNNGQVINNQSVTNNGTTTNNGPVINNNSVENNGPVTNNNSVENNGPVTNNGQVINNGDVINNGNVLIEGDLNVVGDLTKNELTYLPGIRTILTKTNRFFDFTSDVLITTHHFRVLAKALNGAVNVGTLFTPANTTLGVVPNPPGTFAVGPPATPNLFRFVIDNAPAVAPWHFEDLTEDWGIDPIGQRVLFGGDPEIYDISLSARDRELPDNRSLTKISFTIDLPVVTALFNLQLRYSTEAGYDFVTVTLNGVTLPRASVSGYGPSPAEPYLAITIPIVYQTGDVISVSYTKDGSAYQGVDNLYFFITDLQYAPVIPRRTYLYVVRNIGGDDVIIYNFGFATEFDSLIVGADRANVIQEFQFLAGDYLQLSSSASYSQFTIEYIGQL